MKKVYYAHCMKIYYTDQETEDIKLLESLGFKVVNPSYVGYAKSWEIKGMEFARELIDGCDALIFRRAEDGRIPAGIAYEILYAKTSDKPVLEFMATPMYSNIMTREETREYILSGGPEVDWYRKRRGLL